MMKRLVFALNLLAGGALLVGPVAGCTSSAKSSLVSTGAAGTGDTTGGAGSSGAAGTTGAAGATNSGTGGANVPDGGVTISPDAGIVLTGDFPFPIWDGTVPAVPPSTTGKTYYVDGKNGSDTNDGLSNGAPFKTIRKTISLVNAGDTVLIHGGFYREGIDLADARSGSAGKPITFGSFGDGAVILDGSTQVTGWTKTSGTVWHAPVSFTPIAVVVNEVPLKQVRQGQQGSSAPREGIAGVTSGSGKWGVDAGQVVADFGSVDPSTADVIVPKLSQDQQHVFFFGSYYTFKGLTIRGAGSNGIWGYGSNITIESCDIKFNGKAGISFQVDSGGRGNSDDAVITSHVYHNVLVNWPRGNNSYGEDGGGWPGGLSFSTILRPVARGNVVHMNGGEGVLSYGTEAGKPSGGAVFEQNVIFDNWSVNLYFDNQPDCVARNNLIFNHPPDPANFLYVSNSEPWSVLEKYTVGIMLADEENSSDSTNNYANLDRTKVYNNVIAGCRIGIRDYSEGEAHAVRFHGLKNALIANNTIIMPAVALKNTDTMGIFLQDNTIGGSNRNVGTVIQNNLIVGFNSDPVIWSERSAALDGINLNYNLYYSATNTKPFRSGEMSVDLAGWRTRMSSDAMSLFTDPKLIDVTGFRAAGVQPYDWHNADLQASSPARNAGTAQTAFSTNITYATRGQWNIGAF